VAIGEKGAIVDQQKCIKCGRCAQACPYNAIVFRERPCQKACGVGAIHSDPQGFAEINPEICVSCGLCIVSCPFAAIAEKSEIVQVLYALKSGVPVYAEIAPSIVGQFGPLVTPAMLITGLKQLGFKAIKEVALGADIAIQQEAQELIHLLGDKKSDRGFIGTSCCPAWVQAARKKFPEYAKNISESYTPMVESAKKIKQEEPNARVVFIGPCIAKKLNVSARKLPLLSILS
jgi:iron only hydrogenase large subunit-like protein